MNEFAYLRELGDAATAARDVIRTMSADPWAYRSAEGVQKLAALADRLDRALGATPGVGGPDGGRGNG